MWLLIFASVRPLLGNGPAFVLSAETQNQIYIPRWIAYRFLALSGYRRSVSL